MVLMCLIMRNNLGATELNESSFKYDICVIRTDSTINYNFNRATFLYFYPYFINKYHPIQASELANQLENLDIVGEIPYSSFEFGMELKIVDEQIYLENLSIPVTGYILEYKDNELNDILWITTDTIDVGCYQYRISEEFQNYLNQYTVDVSDVLRKVRLIYPEYFD